MNFTITAILAAVTSILLLIFAFFTITPGRGRRLSNLLLSAFLISNALYIINFLLPVIQRTLNISLNFLVGTGFAFGFLFGPLLFLFTQSLTVKGYKISIRGFSHFIPFSIAFPIGIFRFNIAWQVQYSVLHLQLFPYMIACIIVMMRYRNELKEYFSSLEKLNLTWMLYVVGGFLLMWLIDLANFVLSELELNNRLLYNNLLFISIFINFVFVVLIFYKALQQPLFFRDMPEESKVRKYEKSKLTEEDKDAYLVKIIDYFETRKPFLNPSITISDVANDTGINSKYISQVINESLKKNFYDFINYFRIEEAKRKLCEQKENGKTVLEILYDSGFNSKSAFNTTFKKHTGITPTQFRKQILIQKELS